MKLENFSRIHLRCGRTCLDRCFGNKLGFSRLTVLVVNGSSHKLHHTCSILMSTLIQSLLASLVHTVIFHRLSLCNDHSVSATVAAEHAPSHSMIILYPLLPKTKAANRLLGIDILYSRALAGPQEDMATKPLSAPERILVFTMPCLQCPSPMLHKFSRVLAAPSARDLGPQL